MQTSYQAGPQHTRRLFCASHLQLPQRGFSVFCMESLFGDNKNLALEDYYRSIFNVTANFEGLTFL